MPFPVPQVYLAQWNETLVACKVLLVGGSGATTPGDMQRALTLSSPMIAKLEEVSAPAEPRVVYLLASVSPESCTCRQAARAVLWVAGCPLRPPAAALPCGLLMHQTAMLWLLFAPFVAVPCIARHTCGHTSELYSKAGTASCP